jgi:cyclopropane-fatty-acyl-phospholipid synthase
MSTARVETQHFSSASQLELLDDLFATTSRRDFAVRFWDGLVWGEQQNPRFTFIMEQPDSLRRLLTCTSELELGEAFIFKALDVEGDLEEAVAFCIQLLAGKSAIDRLKLTTRIARLPRGSDGHHSQGAHVWGPLHSRFRDRAAVTYHYNLSNDFYNLWLDRRMVYSCAYFRRGDEEIDEAQENKLEYICRKLRLRPGETLLDLGCGWGALILYAAQRFGVHALGITLSQPQAELARQRIVDAGVASRCEVRVCDYRDLDTGPEFDKIASVGMVEHVGESHLPRYFQQAWGLLKPGGVFLNHGIAASAKFHRNGESFIDKYVFPDGDLVPISTTLRVAEDCGFELRDLESLREHYARTLRRWRLRLESHCREAVAAANETAYRIWRLYMAGSAHGFASGRVNIYQALFSKTEQGNSGLPLTREDWYR